MKRSICLTVTFSTLLLAGVAFAADPVLPPPMPPDHPVIPVAPPAAPNWSPPANWKELPASAMVVKTFSIPGEGGPSARVAVSTFSGDVGGVFSNVNRWRAQIGLPPIDQSALPAATQSLEVAGGKATLVDISNPGPKAARLVAIIVPHGAGTWFYKLTGDTAVIEREKAAFLKFVQTVNYPQP